MTRLNQSDPAGATSIKFRSKLSKEIVVLKIGKIKY